jgi:putative endopeptidase
MKNQICLLSGLLFFASCKVSLSEKKEDTSSKLSTVDKVSMSTSIDPSKDFFLFSNENWIKNNPIPPSESRWGSFNELEKSNLGKLKLILEKCATTDNAMKGSVEQILGAYYASFINKEQRNESEYKIVRYYLDKINSLQQNDIEILDQLVAEMHIHGIGAFFGFGVRQDLKNVEYHISYLSQGGLGLPNRDYYFSENKKILLEDYRQYIAEMSIMFGIETSSAKAFSDDVINFETQLASSMLSPAEMRIPEKTYNKLALNEVENLFGSFNFSSYLKSIGSLKFDSLIVNNTAFIKNVGHDLISTDIRVVKNYMSWKVMNHYAAHMSEKLVQKRFDFYGKKLSGKSVMKTDYENAIEEITRSDFGQLLGKKFVELHYSNQAQERVNEMVDNLLLVFRERIQNLDWMSDATKEEALNKLNSIGRKLGFPEEYDDFSSIHFTKDDYLMNFIEIQRFEHYKNLNKLNEAVNKKEWGMPAHMVNAYYHPLLNEIAFPAGIMQPPFFDVNAEDAINYGRIGMVIGHEFTHGFDDMGSKFAADGTFKNWWTENDRKLFEDKTGVLGETFAAFCPIEGHCVNPQLTMGENIADLGGLTMAYYAYARTDEFKKNEKREGFTPAQRFFIAYAQLWKISYTDEELKNRIATDSHSPGMYRVNGPLMNCPEFFEAFGIKEGDPMRNPKEKVARIW